MATRRRSPRKKPSPRRPVGEVQFLEAEVKEAFESRMVVEVTETMRLVIADAHGVELAAQLLDSLGLVEELKGSGK